MYNVMNIKPTELSKIRNVSRSAITQRLKKNIDECETINNRLISIPPHLIERQLSEESEVNLFDKFMCVLSSNVVGGCGKTTSILSYGSALHRMCTNKIIYIDADSQGSLSETLMGQPKDLNEPVLANYFEGKVSLKDIVEKVAEDVYVIRSSLNNTYLDRALQTPKAIKNEGLRLLMEIREMFGERTSVLIDTPPQIGNFLSSMAVGMAQMSETKNIILNPMRTDKFSLSGAVMLQGEIEECLSTFSLPENKIEIISFFSSFDRRVNSSKDAYRMSLMNEDLKNTLSPIAIRYSSEVLKSLNSNKNLFATKDGVKSASASDYMDLVLDSLGYSPKNNEVIQ